MALIPTWYSASTKQIAEKALQRGVLKYPGLCYIQDSKSIAWVTIDNTLEYVKGDKQITDVKCIGSNLMFFSGDKLLFSYDISMTDEDKDHIIEEVKKTIGLDNYVKSSELSTLLDNIIGNLEDKSTVVDYINSLSYCEHCGHEELNMDMCPKCGSEDITKIDRMNGYIGYTRVHGDTRYNKAKMTEIAERRSM